MNNKDFSFIVDVSYILSEYSQFSKDICDFIGCQFAFESNFGHSRLASDNNNYCGMRNPLVRISSAKHSGDSQYHWAQYSDLTSCVVDYLLCLQYHRPISANYDTIEHFSKFISNFYCPEKDYIERINKLYYQFKSYNNENK